MIDSTAEFSTTLLTFSYVIEMVDGRVTSVTLVSLKNFSTILHTHIESSEIPIEK